MQSGFCVMHEWTWCPPKWQKSWKWIHIQSWMCKNIGGAHGIKVRMMGSSTLHVALWSIFISCFELNLPHHSISTTTLTTGYLTRLPRTQCTQLTTEGPMSLVGSFLIPLLFILYYSFHTINRNRMLSIPFMRWKREFKRESNKQTSALETRIFDPGVYQFTPPSNPPIPPNQ
jgi:hypothetical protein